MKNYYSYDITECHNIEGIPSGFSVEVSSNDLLMLRKAMYKYLDERKTFCKNLGLAERKSGTNNSFYLIVILELTPFPIFPALSEPGVTNEEFWSEKTVMADLSVLTEYYASVLNSMDKGLEIHKSFITYISGPKTQQLRRKEEEVSFFKSLPEFNQMELNDLKMLLK